MAVDENGRIRVVLDGENPEYGWATSAPGNLVERDGGYTVEWDDGYADYPMTRWYFDNGDMFDIKAV
jgi:hypothetical protein